MKHEIDNIGNEYWYDDDGNYHREDGPSIIYNIGSCFWYNHGKCHRLDGPAKIYSDTKDHSMIWLKQWYVEGIQYSEEEFLRIVKMRAFL
jgi:hypothetical protein